MPTGREGKKRPPDVIGNAVKAIKLVTGGIEDKQEEAAPGKDPAAASLGRRGGAARARNLSPEKRAEIARKAAMMRWSG